MATLKNSDIEIVQTEYKVAWSCLAILRLLLISVSKDCRPPCPELGYFEVYT